MNVFPGNKNLLLLLIVMVAIGCNADSSGDANSTDGTSTSQEAVTIFAAASTTNAVDAVKAAFVKKTGIPVQTSYAASSTLAQQIANGAEADIFLSANTDWADFVEDNVTVAERQEVFGNRLVIIVPSGSDLQLKGAEGLTSEKVEYLALGDPDAVPAGQYAKQALMELELWEQLKDKVAAAKDVRQALTYVETAAAEAGIVYATDTVISDRVEAAAKIPPGLTKPVRYPVLLLRRAEGNESVQAFYDYLLSLEAAEVFERFGFVVLAKSDPEGRSASPVSRAVER